MTTMRVTHLPKYEIFGEWEQAIADRLAVDKLLQERYGLFWSDFHREKG
jgi:hypothetical protein